MLMSILSRLQAVATPDILMITQDYDCMHDDYDSASTIDIRAVIHALSADPRIDSRRVIVAGQSLGGWNTLALGALNIPNVKGLINFNGGIRESDCITGDTSLVAAAEDFGASARIPSIWFYGRNDGLFPVKVWRAMYNGYTRSGGQAELVDVGVVMKDSHAFLAYPEALALWIPKVDSFLARIGMPSAMVNSGYLPLPFPSATQFAELTDVAAIPLLSDRDRDSYRRFLNSPFPRAFVISETGEATATNTGFDPLGRALALCRKSMVRCGVYAVDDQVVWTPFPAGPHEPPNDLPAQADTISQSPGARTADAASDAATAPIRW
jgi:dienelactone hydrolase